jgi:outer membrane biosynthesis protein TonB
MKISASVIFAHVFLIAFALCLHPPSPRVSPPRRPVVVKTRILPNPVSLAIIQSSAQLPPPKPTLPSDPGDEAVAITPLPPTPPPRPSPKAAPPHPAPPTPPAPSPKPTQKAEAKKANKLPQKPVHIPSSKGTQGVATKHPHHDKLIGMAKKSLASLDLTQNHPSHPTKKAPSLMPPLAPLASETLTFEARYEEELVSYLEALLSFPEKGSVKIKLTLKREGSVEKVEILTASTTQNRDYIKTTLPSCSFPSFGTHFKGETVHTFTLNLMSENSR